MKLKHWVLIALIGALGFLIRHYLSDIVGVFLQWLPGTTHPAITLGILFGVFVCSCGAAYFSMSASDRKNPVPYLFILGALVGSNFSAIKSAFEDLHKTKELVVKIKDSSSNKYLGFVGNPVNNDGRYISLVEASKARTFLLKPVGEGGLDSGAEVELSVYGMRDESSGVSLFSVIFPTKQKSVDSRPSYCLQCAYTYSNIDSASGLTPSATLYHGPGERVAFVPTWAEAESCWALLDKAGFVSVDGVSGQGITFVQELQSFNHGTPRKFSFELIQANVPNQAELAALEDSAALTAQGTGSSPAQATETPLSTENPTSPSSLLAWEMRDNKLWLQGNGPPKPVLWNELTENGSHSAAQMRVQAMQVVTQRTTGTNCLVVIGGDPQKPGDLKLLLRFGVPSEKFLNEENTVPEVYPNTNENGQMVAAEATELDSVSGEPDGTLLVSYKKGADPRRLKITPILENGKYRMQCEFL